MPHLTDSDREALRLADDLQKTVEQWLSQRGVTHSCAVSPYVDSSGQPAVVMKMTAQAAWALIDSLGTRPGADAP
jgi:hypothetical protein